MLHLLPPELTERYEPIDILGYGAFAMVVKARDKKTEQIVAIKHLQTKQGDKQKFFRELNLSTRLRHPNIVRCMDVYASNDQSSDMVFEFADQGMLRTYLPEGEPFDFAQSLLVISHIVQGLEYAHAQGVVHRDLKPENILIFSGPTPDQLVYKIADFGVAKLLGPTQKTATSIGSPSYMAPEQFYDSYDLSSDIYALGIIFYELFHGNVPFDGSAAEIFKGHLEGTIKYRENLHPEVAKLINEMLLKTPGARPKAADVLKRIQQIADDNNLRVNLYTVSKEDLTETHRSEGASGLQMFSDFDAITDQDLTPKPVSTPVQEVVQELPEEQSNSVALAEEEHTEQEYSEFGDHDSETMIEDHENEEDDDEEAILFPGDFVEESVTSTGTIAQQSTEKSRSTTAEEEDQFSLFDDFPGIEKEAPKVPAKNAAQIQRPAAIEDDSEELFPQLGSPDEGEDESDTEHLIHATGSEEFFGGFEDEDAFAGNVVSDLKNVQRVEKANYGRFVIQKKWSRAIDRKTTSLMNLEDGHDLLMVIPGKGLQEIQPGGKKGKLVYDGEYELLGQPILGHVCMIRDQSFCVMQRGEFYESNWKFEDETSNLAISHDLKTVASFAGSTVTCRRWGGKLLWTGQFDRTGKGIFLSFTSDASLMICSYMGEDQAVHFFDQEGESLARFWMNSPIVSATPHHDRIGLWVITEGPDDVCMLHNVTQHHKRPVCGLEKPLHNLKASRDWLAGFDENNQLHLVDLSVGLVMPVKEVAGTPLDIAVGKTPQELYILTTEDNVMRYVTALEIGFTAAEASADQLINKEDEERTDKVWLERKKQLEKEALLDS